VKKLSLKPLNDLAARIQEDRRIYDALTKEERQTVDMFNAAMRGKSIDQLIAMGPHPIIELRKKYQSNRLTTPHQYNML
jgi:hypothetical protein